MEGIEKVNEKSQYKEIKLINSLDSILHYKDDQERDIHIPHQ